MLGPVNSENVTPARKETGSRQQERSPRSPLEDQTNKRSRTAENETVSESESESTAHSNDNAMEIPQNPGSSETGQNETAGGGE